MRSFNRPIWILLAVALVSSLVGCTAPAATTAPAAPAATQPPVAPAAANPVTIHVLTMDQAGLKPAEIDQIVKEFEAKNPDIKVVMEYVSYDNVHDKIVTGMAAKPPAYDAAMIDVIWPDEFIKAGYLLDVTDRVTPQMKSDMFPASWNGVTRNGKVYGMPWIMDVKYFMYNKDMLEKAGISAPPKTWEELVAQAKTIKDKGIVEYPIIWSWNQKEGVVCDYAVLLYGNGGAFLDSNGKPAFNDDKGVQVLTWMKKSIDDGLTNPSSVSSDENAVEANFLAGKSAFAVNWLFQYSDSTDASKSQIVGKAAFAPMPVFDAGAKAGVKGSSVDGSSSFAIMATSPYADQTWKFLTYIASNDVQSRYSAEMLPVWQTDFQGDSLEKLKAATPTNPVTVPAFLSQFPYANERPTVPYYNEGSAALQLAIQEALTGVKSPKQALDDAAAKWVELAKK
ncbi:MAG TPA: extracellular solute-binding protein [Anaerolineaceae bacterium]|nr:extracellular solute-binding protein [Anaerolineaceae bacterium]